MSPESGCPGNVAGAPGVWLCAARWEEHLRYSLTHVRRDGRPEGCEVRQTGTGEVRFDERKTKGRSLASRATARFGYKREWLRYNFIARRPGETEDELQQPGNRWNFG
jgi:hypothetical protein